MYYVMRTYVASLHRDFTDSLMLEFQNEHSRPGQPVMSSIEGHTNEGVTGNTEQLEPEDKNPLFGASVADPNPYCKSSLCTERLNCMVTLVCALYRCATGISCS